MITRYDKNGEVNSLGEFVKMEDAQRLVDFLYEVMSCEVDTAIDILVNDGEDILQEWL